MNRKALFLSSVMLRGHGVSVVAHELSRRVGKFGWDLVVGCLEVDNDFRSNNIVVLPADPNAIIDFCRSNSIDAVVAQTSPYFECLPAISAWLPTIVYEHGDPTPGFFDDDAKERENIRQHKIQNVYPRVSVVAASSHFLAHDIGWTEVMVCTLGCNHIMDLGSKTEVDVEARPLRVGTLMRLGPGEAKYKGNEIFIELVNRLGHTVALESCVMGRGAEHDREFWENQGFEVHLNSTDSERERYLRSLDIFVSSSQWEGFNLPLVEAQALGTLSLAYDVGAHPETTPFVMPSVADAEAFILTVGKDPDLRNRLSDLGRRFVRQKFDWDETAQKFAEILDLAHAKAPDRKVLEAVERSIARRFIGLIRREGTIGSIRFLTKRLLQRTGRR